MAASRASADAQTRSASEWLMLVTWRRKWLILGTFVVAGVIGLLYVRFATPVYTSTAKLYVTQAAPVLPNGQGSGPPPGSENFRQTQREMITSDPVLSIASVTIGSNPTLSRPGKPAVQWLKELVTTDLDKNSDFIYVTAASANPKDAVSIVNGLVNAYISYQTDQTHKTSNAGATIQALDAKIKDTDAQIATINKALHDLEEKWGPLSQKDDRDSLAMKQLQAMSEDLINAERESINAASAWEEAKRALGPRAAAIEARSIDPDEIESDLLVSSAQEQALLRSEIIQTQTLLQELQQRYLPNHPSIIALKNRMDRLNIAYSRSIFIRYEVAKQKEKQFHDRYFAARNGVIEVSKHGSEYARLQDEVDSLRKMRDSLIGTIRGMQINPQASLSIEVSSPGVVASKPTYPNPKRVIPISLAVGLMGGLLLACIWEWVDDRYHSAGDMRSTLGMPVLAVIPQSTAKRSPSILGQRILLDPGSDAAEAYRALRTAVQFAASDGQLKTLLITSPKAGDGKTTLVANLAIAMAQAGKRVMLVDADLRKPSQHEIFGLKNTVGLSMLLGGRCTLESATQRGAVPGLDVLTCGPTPANPAEILNSTEFGDLLEQLADKYDYVVLDSPPVQSANDARIMAGLCDGTMIVLKAQSAHRRETEMTRDALLSVGAKVVGLVVNDLPRRSPRAYGQGPAAQRRLVSGLTSQEYDILQARVK